MSVGGRGESNNAPNVLDYLATPQDRVGAHGGAACTVDVAARSALAIERLPVSFCVVLEP
jgi:hypothetical protein